MSEIKNFPAISRDPEQLLYNMLRELKGKIEDIVIVVYEKGEEEERIYSSTVDKQKLALASIHVADIARLPSPPAASWP